MHPNKLLSPSSQNILLSSHSDPQREIDDFGFGMEINYENALENEKKTLICEELQKAGYEYYTGTNGREINYEEALKLFTKARDLGSSLAFYYSGKIFENGHGVEKNYKKAEKFYIQSGNLGENDGIYDAGRLNYYGGFGLEQNYQEAFKYFEIAAENGKATAYDYLGDMHRKGLGVEKNKVEAGKNYKKCFEKKGINKVKYEERLKSLD